MAGVVSLILLLLTVFPSTTYGDEDYFDRITLYSNGRITRFSEMPIKVFIDENSLPVDERNGYVGDLLYALQRWQDSSGGLVRFRRVSRREETDLSVEWIGRSLSSRADNALGEAILMEMEDESGLRWAVEVQLSTVMPDNVTKLSHDRMKMVALHEIGHALGLWGHSPLKGDVMYPSSENLTPSARDINTLRRLYSTPPGTPQHRKALKILGDMISKAPKNARLHYLIGSVYLDMGDYDRAIDHLLACLELDIRYMAAGQKLVRAYLRKGEEGEAIKRYELILEQNPTPEIHNQTGILLFQSGDYDKAIDHFRKALQLKPGFTPARKNLLNVYKAKAEALMKQGGYDEAIEALKSAIKLNPVEAESHLMLGVVLSRSGRFADAADEFETVLKLNPGYKEAKLNLAATYNSLGIEATRRGEWDEAIRLYEKALRLNPERKEIRSNLVAAHWNKSESLISQGRYRPALEYLRRCLELNPSLKEAYLQIGVIHAKLREYPKAITALQKAIEMDPNYAEAKYNLLAVYHAYAQ
ncbi:TPA: tetratricopeptide repeat protein, partial [Candidatus Poribacteria bacterium]|nr:tetratricopeptide repeat protein [Candidatus Poribacteria bacterium]